MANTLAMPELSTGQSADIYVVQLANSRIPEAKIMAQVVSILLSRIGELENVIREGIPFPVTFSTHELTVGKFSGIAAVTGTADAAYSANEVTLINDLKTAVNAIRNELAPK